MVEVRIPMEKDEHKQLSKTKKEHGYTWKEMLKESQKELEG